MFLCIFSVLVFLLLILSKLLILGGIIWSIINLSIMQSVLIIFVGIMTDSIVSSIFKSIGEQIQEHVNLKKEGR